MLSAIGSALVAGSVPSNQEGEIMAGKRVRALRAFYYNGKVIDRGKIVDLPELFARQVIGSNKAEVVEANPHATETEAPAGKSK